MERASFSTDTLSNDGLFAGRAPSSFRKVTLLSGQNTVRGAVLGRKTTAGTIAGAAQAGNTGDGTIGTLSVGGRAMAGRYRVVCIEPAADAGKFSVEAPDGRNIGVATVAVAFAGEINFTIADGAADFVAGDAFNIDVSALTQKYELSAIAATDGSETPDAILAEDCDASAADAECLIYEDGVFNQSQLTFGTGHTADTVRDTLRAKGIILVAAGSVVNP